MNSIVEDADRFGLLMSDLGQSSPGRLTSHERRDLLLTLAPTLLRATELGRKKLARFRAESPPVPQTREEIRESVLFYGDRSLLATVAEALALAPAPVRASVIDQVAFLAVGVDSRAWTSSLRFVTADGRQRHRVIVLGPDAGVRTVLHECGHIWHGAPLEDEAILNVAITAQGEEGFAAFMAERGDRAAMEAHMGLHERLADACAFVWLPET